VIDILYLVWRYLRFHRWKALILLTSITLIIYLPVGLNVLVDQSSAQLTARAAATPLLIGARGSPLELTLNSLYFESATPAPGKYFEVARVRETGLATPIPLYVRFNVRGQPIVGTALEYFEFRRLGIEQGRAMARLGEAVLGSAAARALGVGVGESVISSPEDVFDLAGVYPLKMRVVGILAPSFTADDAAVFVDIKTAWIMEGLGHGHQDLESAEAASTVMARDGNKIVANASVVEYNEITDANIDSFHFHGDNGDFPVSAVLAVPANRKSGVILQGRYENDQESSQIVRPVDVVTDLLGTLLTIQQFVIAAVVIVGLATVATAILVFLLSARLRRRERLTLFKIGAAKSAVTSLLLAEVFGVIAASIVFAAVLTALTGQFGADLIKALLLH
jgi:putative ABC transport system permease protein